MAVQRTVYKDARDTLAPASLAVCYGLKLKPTSENLRHCRQTLYQWARARYTDWKDAQSLTGALAMVCIAAVTLGTPWTTWEYGRVGNTKWPANHWPAYKSPPQWTAVLKEKDRAYFHRTQQLWQWYHANI